jgi:DNA-binding NarL/FixJ family response regulator
MSLSISGTDLSQRNPSYDESASHTAATAKHNQSPAKSDQAQSKSDQATAKTEQTQSNPAQSAAKLSEEQQLEQLVAEGESTQQIATILGLTVTQVEQTLGTTSGSQTAASSLVALAGRLSIKA